MKPRVDMEEMLRHLESPVPHESLRARVLERASAAIDAATRAPRKAAPGSASWLLWAAAAIVLALANVFSDRVLPFAGGVEQVLHRDEPTLPVVLAEELGLQETRPFSIAPTPAREDRERIRSLLEKEDLF